MARINGTNGNDTIDEVGNGGSTTGSDEIFAMAGNDRIILETNDSSMGDIVDKVHGGDGIDTLVMDVLNPDGFDVGTGSAAAGYTGSYDGKTDGSYVVQFDGIEQFELNVMTTGTLTTGDGADKVTDSVAGATINTGGGADLVTASLGNATIDMGGGRDRLTLALVGHGNAVYVGTALSGSVAAGYSGSFTNDYNGSFSFAGVEDFTISTGDYADTITTGDGNDIVSTNGGNDIINVGKGDNTVDGGANNDQLSIDLSAQTTGSTIDLRILNAAQASGGTNQITNVEGFGTVIGSNFADTLIEGNVATFNGSISGGGGNDVIQMSTGTDTIDGGTGTDTMILDFSASGNATHIDQALGGSLAAGYSGSYLSDYNGGANFSGIENFKIYGNDYADTIITGDGNDVVTAAGGNDTITVGKGTNIVDGGANNDQLSIDLSGQAVASTIDLTKTGQQASGGTNSVMNVEGFTGTITGSAHGDTLIEGNTVTDNATFNMGAGNDTIGVSTGTDTINGGAGSDTLVLNYAGTGNATHIDQPLGGTFQQGYSGTYTNDYGASTAFTGIETFKIFANNYADTIITGDGNDVVSTAGGNDVISVGKGANTVDGGTENDQLSIDLSAQTTGSTIDLTKTGQQASGGTNSIMNVEGFGTVVGSNYADTLIEGNIATFNGTISGGGGNDVIAVRTGTDTIDGGAGFDTMILDFSANGNATHIDQLNGSLAAGYSGTYTSDYNGGAIFSGIEKFEITGNDYADTIITGDSDDTVSTAGGDDILSVGKGANTVDGGANNDRLSIDLSGQFVASTIDLTKTGQEASGGTNSIMNVEGFAGTVTGSAHGDTLIEGNTTTYDATFNMGAGNDTVGVSTGNDTINGGAGTDTLVLNYAGTGNAVHSGTALSGSVGAGYSGSFVSDYGGTATFTAIENFQITANNYADTITTGDGDDVVSGGGGNDTIATAGGNDLVLGGAGDDSLDGGMGNDTVSYADATGSVALDLGVVTQQATGGGGNDTIAGFENVTGSAFADTLTGTSGDNVIDGGVGADAMSGGDGNDTYYVDSTGDTISDTSGTDTVYSAITYTLASNLETLYAADPAATTAINLTGNAGPNVIGGNAGNNVLTGGGGTDRLTYAFATAGVTIDLSITAAQNTGGAGTDTISGFENLTGSAFNDTLSGNSGNNVLDGGGGTDTVSYADAAANVTVSLATTAAQVTGDGTDTLLHFANLTGSSHDDTLTGSSGANTIMGGAGNDTIDGGLGNDVLDGGTGINMVSYRSATSGVTVNLTAGQATGGGGTDGITNFQNIIGSNFADTLTGSTAANVIDGGAGADTMTGGAGSDTYYVDNSGDKVFEKASDAGTDRVLTSVSYALAAGQAIEQLTTTSVSGTGSINLTGNEFAQTIQGNAGANILDGKAGADTLYGFGGNDSYYIDNAGDQVFEAANAGTDRVLASVSYALAAGQSIERLTTTGSSGTSAINLTGNEQAQIIQGNAGANILDGKGGADMLYGYGGNDTYYVDNAGDRVFEAAAAGTDQLIASVSYRLASGQSIETMSLAGGSTGTAALNLTGNELAQTIQGNAAANTIDGFGGGDMLYGYGGNDLYTVHSASDRVFEAVGGGSDRVLATVSYALAAGQEIERLQTTQAAGTTAINLTGNEFGQIIQGNAGANILDGKGGADSLYGFGGNDTYYVDNAGDRVYEAAGGGTDTVIASASFTLTSGQEIEKLTATGSAGTNAINLTGNDFGQTIQGNAAANTIDGRGGVDILYGYAGDDTYVVDNAGDQVIEAANGGNDRVLASVSYTLGAGQEIERLQTTQTAGTTAIDLTGNAFGQIIQGNAGANVIDGGLGADTLYGFGGADTFAFTTTLGSGNVDTIIDFANSTNTVHDRISLSRAVFANLNAGSALTAGGFRDITGGVTLQADDRILYNHDTGALFYDADGSGSTAAVQFATIGNKVTLTSADFTIAG